MLSSLCDSRVDAEYDCVQQTLTVGDSVLFYNVVHSFWIVSCWQLLQPSWSVSALCVFFYFISFLSASSCFQPGWNRPNRESHGMLLRLIWLRTDTGHTDLLNRYFFCSSFLKAPVSKIVILTLWVSKLVKFWCSGVWRPPFPSLTLSGSQSWPRSFCFHFDNKSSPVVLSVGSCNSLHAKSWMWLPLLCAVTLLLAPPLHLTPQAVCCGNVRHWTTNLLKSKMTTTVQNL